MEMSMAYYTFLRKQHEMSEKEKDENSKIVVYGDRQDSLNEFEREAVDFEREAVENKTETIEDTIETKSKCQEKIKLAKYNPNKQYRRVMVFDVETTGLLPKKDPITKIKPQLENMPYITQLSFIIYNVRECYIEKKYNAYINIPENVDISEKITEITGITKEFCKEKGVLISDVLCEFYKEYSSVDCIVAHNIDFDRTMIEIEIERNFKNLEIRIPQILNVFHPVFLKSKGIDVHCTMKESIHLCNIMMESKNDPSKKFKKFPRLGELYYTLFRTTPENLHNSLVDSLVCLRCFLRIRLHKEIHDAKYNHMLKGVIEIK
jgi:DNA polymerase-3 subunit epsilon